MKSKFKKLFLCLFMVVLLPLSFVLTGCGATPQNDVVGVAFDSMIYDEETGYAVFEVDPNITTPLTYKVFPSTCTGYKIYFDPVNKGTDQNSARYKFEDGQITVTSDKFEEVTYKVRIGEFEDTCIIRLKEYPVDIRPEHATMVVGAYETVSINILGTFVNANGVSTTRPITEHDFNFLVEPEDETIIGVFNPNRLKFSSIRGNSAQTKVNVYLLNANGEKTGLKCQIDVTITQNAGDAFLLLEKGYGKFIRNDQTVEIDYNELETVGSYKAVKFDLFVLTENSIWIEQDGDVQIQLSNKNLAKTSDDGSYILLSDSIANGYELEVNICTNLTKKDGSLFIVNLTLKIVR